jgi:hypothetical protein
MEKSDTPDKGAGEENVSRIPPDSDSLPIESSNSRKETMESAPHLQRKLVSDPDYPNMEIIRSVVEKLLDGFTKK